MKKSRGLIVTFVPLLIVAVGLWFFPGSSAFADDHHSPPPSPSSHDSDHHDSDRHDSDHHDDHHDGDHHDEHDKCTVCHDPHNFHEISIPCGQVDKFLGDHPGDYRGQCSTTPSTNK